MFCSLPHDWLLVCFSLRLSVCFPWSFYKLINNINVSNSVRDNVDPWSYSLVIQMNVDTITVAEQGPNYLVNLIDDWCNYKPRYTLKWVHWHVCILWGDTIWFSWQDDVVQFSANPVTYSFQQPFSISPSTMNTKISSLGIDPFTLGPSDGIIRTNIYFQSTWSGYFRTVVAVNDANSNLTRSKANLTVCNHLSKLAVPLNSSRPRQRNIVSGLVLKHSSK